ncbi:MAG: DUF2092 domain-containing protein [Burkholderiales bacterium]|nr:DUF2092 domain-containing protein [Burkholderiales bacterium]
MVPIAAVLVAGIVSAQSPNPQTAVAPPATKQAAPKAKPAGKAGEQTFKMVLEPRAMDLLKATSAKLAAAKSMSFTAVVGYEYPSRLWPPIVYTTRYDIAMQRPDKLRVLMPGDGPASEFYYDGKSMTAYAPAEKLAAVVDAPASIDAMLRVAFQKAAIYFPFSDALVADPYTALTDGAILAFYVGPSAVMGGTRTDMVVWANPDVFVQMWIGADDKLPRRMRAIFAADPLALRHEMELSNWQLDPALPPDTFTSAAAQSAGRMAFAAPAPPPRGAKPITSGRSTPASGKAPGASD